MDPAVALVQAYLQLNGYLTIAESPIAGGGLDGSSAVTDVDCIALRFPSLRRSLLARATLPPRTRHWALGTRPWISSSVR